MLLAWKEFAKGKRGRKDVQEFERNFMANIFALHRDLVTQEYRHAAYDAFNISDPKPRSIHKASVRDRLLHRALYRVLYPLFDRRFITHSYSCREHKGTHKALNQFRTFAREASFNYKQEVWVLKCDVRKFFASIDHACLLSIIRQRIRDKNILWLIARIVDSFDSGKAGRGLPLGNLTSQLLVNIYMNKLDQFVVGHLRVRFYIRYADDFVMLSRHPKWLEEVLISTKNFLHDELSLTLHPDKVSISNFASGVDFLGWVHFHDHRILRTSTKRRMLRNIREKYDNKGAVASYLGLLSHGNTFKLKTKVEKLASACR